MKEARTLQQNRALHKFFGLLAEELNKAGLDMKVVLKPEVDIPWTAQMVKEFLWRPIQKAYIGKQSTTELEKVKEIDEIYEILNRHLAQKFGEFGLENVPFPSLENLLNQNENL